MAAPFADLSSIASNLEEVTRRVGAIATQAEAEHNDEIAIELFAVERALRGAARRLGKVASDRPRR